MGAIGGGIERRSAVRPAHAAAQRQPVVEQRLYVLEVERIDALVLVIVGGRERRHDRVVEAEAIPGRAQPVLLGIPAEQQLVAAKEIDARLQARADDVEIALVAVERRARGNSRAQGRRVVEVVDVVDAIELEEPAQPVGGSRAGQADVERAVVAVVGGKDVCARAAKAGVEHAVGADIEIDADCSRRSDSRATMRRNAAVQAVLTSPAAAATDVKVVALAAIGARRTSRNPCRRRRSAPCPARGPTIRRCLPRTCQARYGRS